MRFLKCLHLERLMYGIENTEEFPSEHYTDYIIMHPSHCYVSNTK